MTKVESVEAWRVEYSLGLGCILDLSWIRDV